MEKGTENTILIVDDEKFNLDFLSFALDELEDTVVLQEENALDALQRVSKENIDLIILDISMPGMDGLEALQKLKEDEVHQYIPVIMVTAKDEERHKALEYGAEDFLTKPIDVIELRFKINNLLKLKKFNDLQQYFNQRLEEEVAKKEAQLKHFAHVEKEMLMAKNIQESILPSVYPTSSKLDIFGSCTQANEVGGDYFDVFETNCKKYTIFIMADVSGHGFSSALMGMQFRTLIRAELAIYKEDFAKSIEHINTIFCTDNAESSMFITGLFLRYNHETSMLESINAGHFNPMGNKEMIHQSGIPLGIMPNITYKVLETKFEKGDSILLYTDGLIEGENSEGKMYTDLLNTHYQTLLHLGSQKQVEALLKSYHAFIENQIDDVTLLAIQA